ncbi:hypothetical protein DPMN_023588 [Dreissena polymorpha]|uniref:Uncharacterized protein n=1 Tax=Dreissena polymorpha TaxID=45954 RepID=A0A9D4LL02_DREPO|nr:hypothetical protein DPMN_023588 [Dreissena polymorpha]
MRCLQKSSCHASHSDIRQLFRSNKQYGLASRQLKSISGKNRVANTYHVQMPKEDVGETKSWRKIDYK